MTYRQKVDKSFIDFFLLDLFDMLHPDKKHNPVKKNISLSQMKTLINLKGFKNFIKNFGLN